MQPSSYLCLFVISSIVRSKACKSWETVSPAPGYCSIVSVRAVGKSKQGWDGREFAACDVVYEGLTPREAVPIHLPPNHIAASVPDRISPSMLLEATRWATWMPAWLGPFAGAK
jgi:hypothetical protein